MRLLLYIEAELGKDNSGQGVMPFDLLREACRCCGVNRGNVQQLQALAGYGI